LSLDLGTADPLEPADSSAAKTEGRTGRKAPRLVRELLGSLGRIAFYAGATAAIGLVVLLLALLASGILVI
jgi:hypothetical protein